MSSSHTRKARRIDPHGPETLKPSKVQKLRIWDFQFFNGRGAKGGFSKEYRGIWELTWLDMPAGAFFLKKSGFAAGHARRGFFFLKKSGFAAGHARRGLFPPLKKSGFAAGHARRGFFSSKLDPNGVKHLALCTEYNRIE